MKYLQARQGRIFIIRLEDGEILHETIERFAVEQEIKAAYMIALGGADRQSRLVVGPEDGRASPVNPMTHELADVHEIFGTGTLFPDKEGTPLLHMHVAAGRLNSTITGCVRNGVKIWQVAEVVLIELLETTAVRKLEPALGFKLLKP
ncbi:MAG: PPC domain-containing DNA-binding protein [Thermodesulfobacteriota bacterium]|jgi:predicted DNA-binding protein with PD1-like motif